MNLLLVQMIPPPPPMSPDSLEDDEALGSMLISWYMSGYHMGNYLVQFYYLLLLAIHKCRLVHLVVVVFFLQLKLLSRLQGLKQGRREAAASKKSHRK